MSVAVRRDRPMRVAEFLAFAADKPEAERWEMIDGAAALTTPPSERHQAIVSNLIVDQDAPQVTVRRRTATGWTEQAARPGETIPVPELGGGLDVAAVYAGIPLDPA